MVAMRASGDLGDPPFLACQGRPVREGGLPDFRTARRAFEAALHALDDERLGVPLSGGGASPRDLLVLTAAWLNEAFEQILRAQAGAAAKPSTPDTFEAAVLTAATGWTPRQAFGAYRRAADRFETMTGELTDEDLDEDPDVHAWLERAGQRISASAQQISRVGTSAPGEIIGSPADATLR